MDKKEWNSIEFEFIEYDVEDDIITSSNSIEGQNGGGREDED